MHFSSFVSAACFAFLLGWTPVVAQIPRPAEVEAINNEYSKPVTEQLDARGVLRLFERQSGCYSPNRYCALYDKCCSSTAGGCCPDGCTTYDVNECCTVGGYCRTGKECCNDGCMPSGSQCCRSGGYCPPPFICVIYDGEAGCCTDLSCTVYLSGGETVTATPTSRYVTPAPTRTSRATTIVETETYYFTYYTTFYWYYWYYFYTVYYSPSTYTTRERTTVSRTSYVTVTATDTYAAEAVFLSISSDLPTPTDAEITIPPSPASGDTIIGKCTSQITSSVTDSDGSLSRTIVQACETFTASAGAARSTSAARSSASSGNGGDSNIGQASIASHTTSASWIGFLMLSVMSGTLALAIVL